MLSVAYALVRYMVYFWYFEFNLLSMRYIIRVDVSQDDEIFLKYNNLTSYATLPYRLRLGKQISLGFMRSEISSIVQIQQS